MVHLTTYIAAVFAFAATVIQGVGLFTNTWTKIKTPISFGTLISTIGFWKRCVGDDCETIYYPEEWVEICRAFGILGFLFLVLSCAAFAYCSSGQSPDVKCSRFSPPGFTIIAACFIMGEFASFAVESSKHFPEGNFDYSFGLTIVAFILSIGATVLFCIGTCKDDD